MNKWQNVTFHSPVIFFFLLLILILFLQTSMVESNNFDPSDNNTFKPPNDNNPYPNSKISPSVAIIVVLLVVALFFMGFFSIYIRHCSDANNSGGNSVRNALAIAERGRTAAARGLEASVIETFPTFSYSEVKDHKIGKGALECAVCLNEFEDDEKLRLIPKCDHVFHPECIDAWLENHVTCPVCRTILTPEPGDEPYRLPELNQERLENNGDIAIQLDVQEVEVKPEVNRIWSFKYLNRPPRTESLKRDRRNTFGLGKFRSHSTGHLIQPSENMDRFTLRLPEDIRKEMMNRTLLNQTKSVVVHFPRDGSTRRWFRTELGGGSMKGTSSLPKIEKSDRIGRSDRWSFSKTGMFFSRKLSMKSTKIMAETRGASASTIAITHSFTNLESKNIDENNLLWSEPVRPPT